METSVTTRKAGTGPPPGTDIAATDTQHANRSAAERNARALGWLSIGLGAAQLSAPNAMSRLCGLDDSSLAPTLMRVAGLRECGQGAMLLGAKRPGRWVWTRVAGDLLDLTMLGVAAGRRTGTRRLRVSLTAAATAGITALDVLTASRATRAPGSALHVGASTTVNRPPQDVYRFWRDFERLPQFMDHLESVEAADDRTSHWRARAPFGQIVEWDAEIVEDIPAELISWHSTPGARVMNAGVVRFAPAPAGRGTEVRVELAYQPPAGALGAAVAKLFGEEPEQQIRDDLRRFKQVIETGEIVRSESSPLGTTTRHLLRQHPARPATDREATHRRLEPAW